MGYVALSRVRSLDGLFLTGFNDKALEMHDEIHALDHQLRAASDIAERWEGANSIKLGDEKKHDGWSE
jgi:hypothetical protein